LETVSVYLTPLSIISVIISPQLAALVKNLPNKEISSFSISNKLDKGKFTSSDTKPLSPQILLLVLFI
jgi:hypothetical protein